MRALRIFLNLSPFEFERVFPSSPLGCVAISGGLTFHNIDYLEHIMNGQGQFRHHQILTIAIGIVVATCRSRHILKHNPLAAPTGTLLQLPRLPLIQPYTKNLNNTITPLTLAELLSGAW